MNRIKFYYRFFIVLVVGVFFSCAQKTTSYVQENATISKSSIESRTKYHIILVIDGPRYSETYGDSTCKYIPNLGKNLIHQGTFFSNFKALGSTYTNPGHVAFTTGVYQKVSNEGVQLPKNPSIFQYLLKEKKLDKRKAWILTSKGKLQMLANCSEKAWWNQYMPSTYCGVNGSGQGYPGDEYMYPIFKEIIFTHKPVLTLINLLDVDAWAHQRNWERYVKGIVDTDQMALDLWNSIQKDPEMRDHTALYITNDHGRHLDGHKDGYISHGDKCEGCRKISLLALGPEFEKNKIIDTEYSQIDLTATIAHLLNIAMPTATGKVINELVSK